MSELFGIWGGQPPGGWCHIWYPGCDRSSYRNTREEAERGLRGFLKEKHGYMYEVVPFDPAREPTFKCVRPTAAQLNAMRVIQIYKTIHVFSAPKRETMNVLFRNGWCVFDIDSAQGYLLTTGGERLLAEYETKKTL